jgi:nucleoside 2-deoxyribosyltransferase
MKTITAPNKLTRSKKPLVFLAGSIEMGKATHWQEKVIQELKTYKGTLLNPRRSSWDSSWVQSMNNPRFKEQVEWELTGIEQSDLILFYFDPQTLSPITLMEYGYALGKEKTVIVSCAEPFWRKGNVDIIASRHNITVLTSLDALINEAKTHLTT